MEPITLTVITTALATIFIVKPFEKIGENIGDILWEQGGKLITKLREKKQAPSLTASIEAGETLPIDYGQAVLELTAAAEKDPEIAQAVLDVEAAVNNNQSETAKEIKAKAEKIESDVKYQPSVMCKFNNQGNIKGVGYIENNNAPINIT